MSLAAAGRPEKTRDCGADFAALLSDVARRLLGILGALRPSNGAAARVVHPQAGTWHGPSRRAMQPHSACIRIASWTASGIPVAVPLGVCRIGLVSLSNVDNIRPL